ncbi:hypothetical protein M440DRAFT_1421569 [Trichoderma longibrachiatum ATCC 18648]|uniref:Uncharacterized protein n=1 Tax=Trichoderma longibrachiatum ATCC 18648 TaxID=983965 RepID=A0A2T4C8C8_TRILO|nr:hypothetical protein M440DRAFT_1421569 [Trichoderma longibrachiatum ATCC 18648]
MPTSPIDISSLVAQSDLTPDLKNRLSPLLDAAINSSSSSSSSPSNIEAAAAAIDEVCPRNQDAEGFLWPLWDLLIDIAKCIPLDDNERISSLVGIVTSLQAKQQQGETVEIWGSSHDLWSDLPLFGAVMREAWNGNPDFEGSPEDAAKIAEWLSLNSFAARLLGASAAFWTNFALWELRDGLEEPLSNEEARDTHLTTASEWMIRAGKVLYDEVRKNVELDEHDVRALAPGSLFEGGSPGSSQQRWTFWKKRLQELSAEAGAEAKTRTQKALEVMESLEA